MDNTIQDREHIARELLAQTTPARPGDVAHWLMEATRIGVAPPATMRVHHALPYLLGGECFGHFPAILAPLQTGAGRTVGFEIIYVAPSAGLVVPVQRHWVEEVRGAFFQIDPVLGPAIGVGLAVDSVIAARLLLQLPVDLCAVVCPEDLAAFDWPEGTRELVIFASDSVQTQAEELAARALDAGIAAVIVKPPTPGATWYQELVFSGAVPADGVSLDHPDEH